MFVFGTNSYGELGLGFAGAPVSAPARLDSLCGRGVRQVACGDNHTLVYTAEELLYSFGHNSFGQLVHARLPAVLHPDTHGTLTHTECCHRVSNTKRMHAALSLWLPCPATRCGLWPVAATMASLSPQQTKRELFQLPRCSHTPSHTRFGVSYVWGCSFEGRLGLGERVRHQWSPQRLGPLCGKRVAALACGYNHTIVLTQADVVYGFGANSFGQLVRSVFPPLRSVCAARPPHPSLVRWFVGWLVGCTGPWVHEPQGEQASADRVTVWHRH